MPGTWVHLLGDFDVVVDGRPVTEFESATTQALLARLAYDPGQRLARHGLAEMLWPDRPPGRALANLRHSLAVLRRALGESRRDRPVIVADRETVGIDSGADLVIDVAEFRRLADTPASQPGAVAAWQQATRLRRGPFLSGLDLALSEEWDTWLLTARTTIDQMAASVLERLTDLRLRTGEPTTALGLARDWVELDPWNERAHAQLIRLLALDGQPAAALAHAQALGTRLAETLGVEPGAEIRGLVVDVREGRLTETHIEGPDLPTRPAGQVLPAACVARDGELAWLRQRLDDTLAGGGGVVFVTGAAGSGKTVLLRTFASQCGEQMPSLRVLTGAGNAYTGPGDPFLPFREIFGLLCGDLRRAWFHGAITGTQAAQLWAGLPEAVEAVLDEGPYLLGTLIDAPGLLQRFEGGYSDDPLGPRLADAVEKAVREAQDPMRQQRPLLDQCVQVLTRIAATRPMLLVVDDLHWADAATIDLLRHLDRQLDGVPILAVAAFRPSDGVREGTVADPINLLVGEAQVRSRADCVLDLVGTRDFVDTWLDAEPNLLGEQFRQRLLQVTGGNALYTVEMVAALRRRGDLALDERGRWVASPDLAWGTLPPRVEATVEARTRQLPGEVRRDLAAASVQGDVFRVPLLAEVRGAAEAEVSDRLGGLCAVPHALIEQAGTDQVGGRRIDRYRFRHSVIRQHLYERLAPHDRARLHEATGRALAALYVGRLDDVAVELARHFDEAGLVREAIKHRALAGRTAMRLSGPGEAIGHFQRAVELVSTLEPSPARDLLEIGLVTGLAASLQARDGYTAPENDVVYERLLALVDAVGTARESAEALGSLVVAEGLSARYGDAMTACDRMLRIATELDAPPVQAVAHAQLGWLLLMTTRLREAEEHLDQAIRLCDEEWADGLTYFVGFHLRSMALSWRAMTAVILGRPDRARRDSEAAISEARRIGHPFSLTFALAVGGCAVAEGLAEDGSMATAVDEARQAEADTIVAMAQEALEIAEQEDFPFYRAAALLHRGLGRALARQYDQGLRDAARGLTQMSELGSEAFRPWLMCSQSLRLVNAGRLEEAAQVIAAVESRLQVAEEPIAELFLPLSQAALLRARGDDPAAEVVLRRAMALDEQLGALGPQLRAATGLAELLCDGDRATEARSVLEPVLALAREGGDTPSTRVAGAVLIRASA